MQLDNKLVTDAIAYGIIDKEELLRTITMRKEEQILETHKQFSTIWENQSGAFVTYIPDEEKPRGRRQISSKTLEGLNKKVIAHYKAEEKKSQTKAVTLESLYPEWLSMKQLECTSSTVKRLDDYWRKYYKDSPIIRRPLKSLTKADIKSWKLSMVDKHHFTKKAYFNTMGIINQMFDYSVDKEILTANLSRLYEADTKLLTKVKKPESSTQVYLRSEQPLLEQAAWTDFYQTSSTTPLSIILGTQLGCRIGELVALKWEDISGNYIHIQRMEQRVCKQDEKGNWLPDTYTVVEHTKSAAGDRSLFLTKKAVQVLNTIMDYQKEHQIYHKDGFIFVDSDGQRILKRAADNRIRKCCEKAGIPTKSFHKLRKTYISTLLEGGININTVRLLAGHEDEKTTLNNYTYDTNDTAQIENEINRCLA